MGFGKNEEGERRRPNEMGTNSAATTMSALDVDRVLRFPSAVAAGEFCLVGDTLDAGSRRKTRRSQVGSQLNTLFWPRTSAQKVA